jgi:hypothetical protein
MRTILYPLLVGLLLWGCRRDAVIVEAPRVAVCTTWTGPYSFDTDTITRWHDQVAAEGISMKLAPTTWNVNGDIFLSAWSSSVWLSPSAGTAYNQWASVRASAQDSIGVFLKAQAVPYRLVPFVVGDTLDPDHLLSPSQPLYEFVVGGFSPFVYDYDVWYVGIVKIIDTQKYVGYVRIGSAPVPNGTSYWFEDARLSDCAAMPMVIQYP